MTEPNAQPATPQRRIHLLLFLLIVVVVIAGGIYWLYATGPVIENQTGHIVGNGPSVLAAADFATFGQLGSVSTTQLAEWEQAGRVALLPVGTQVLVLSVDGIQSKVRVLDTGKEFYVQTTSVGR